MAEVFNTEKLSQSTERKPPTLGPQEARIIRVIDLGVRRPHPKFPEAGAKRRILTVLELMDDKVVFDGKEGPMVSFHEFAVVGRRKGGEHSKCTALLEAAGIKGEFILSNLVGKPVLVTHGKDENGRVGVTMVSGVSKRAADTMPQPTLDTYVIELTGSEDAAVEKLSEKMRKKISEALNFPGSELQKQFDRIPVKSRSSDRALDTSTPATEAPF